MIEICDDEDIYLEEGQVSEKIKNEITQFTNRFLNEYLKLEETDDLTPIIKFQ